MKKVKMVAICLVLVLSLLLLVSCNGTPSIEFNKKIANANEYSVDIVYTSGNDEPIYISCVQKDGKYAYRFSLNNFDNEGLAYRQIFADNTFYEICENKTTILNVWTGEYKKTENVEVNDDKNFMFKYMTLITAGSFATLLKKGKDVQYRDLACTQFSFTYDDAIYTYIFENTTSNLLKFVMTNEDGVKTLEYYNYKFENVSDDRLALPQSSIGIGGVALYRQVQSFTYEFVL